MIPENDVKSLTEHGSCNSRTNRTGTFSQPVVALLVVVQRNRESLNGGAMAAGRVCPAVSAHSKGPQQPWRRWSQTQMASSSCAENRLPIGPGSETAERHTG
jgi:hypothetical protein